MLVVARAGDGAGRDRRLDARDLLRRQGRRRARRATRRAARACARRSTGTIVGPLASTQAIASCEGVTPFSAASRASAATSAVVALAVLAGEARQVGAEVARARRPRAAQQAAREDAVGGDADAELGEQREDLRLRPAADERVLDLQVGDRVDGVRRGGSSRGRPRTGRSRARSPPSPARRSRRSCPRSAPSGRGAPGGRCRRGRGRAGSGCRRGSSAPRRAGASTPSQLPSGRAQRAELHRDERLVAPVAQRAADQQLVVARAVEVAGVEQRDAAVERGVDRRDALRPRRRGRTCRTCPCSRGRAGRREARREPSVRGASGAGSAMAPNLAASGSAGGGSPDLRDAHRLGLRPRPRRSSRPRHAKRPRPRTTATAATSPSRAVAPAPTSTIATASVGSAGHASRSARPRSRRRASTTRARALVPNCISTAMLDSANSWPSSPRLTIAETTIQVTATARSGTPPADRRSRAKSSRPPAASAER